MACISGGRWRRAGRQCRGMHHEARSTAATRCRREPGASGGVSWRTFSKTSWTRWCGIAFSPALCHGSRDKCYRMFPSQETIISIQTRDISCLRSPCKIPANMPYHPRRRSRRGPREPRRKTPESSRTCSLQYSGVRPVISAWRSVADGASRYLPRGALG